MHATLTRKGNDVVASICIGRTGETCTLDPDMTQQDALAYWLGRDKETFVAEEAERSLAPTACAQTKQAAADRCALAVS